MAPPSPATPGRSARRGRQPVAPGPARARARQADEHVVLPRPPAAPGSCRPRTGAATPAPEPPAPRHRVRVERGLSEGEAGGLGIDARRDPARRCRMVPEQLRPAPGGRAPGGADDKVERRSSVVPQHVHPHDEALGRAPSSTRRTARPSARRATRASLSQTGEAPRAGRRGHHVGHGDRARACCLPRRRGPRGRPSGRSRKYRLMGLKSQPHVRRLASMRHRTPRPAPRRSATTLAPPRRAACPGRPGSPRAGSGPGPADAPTRAGAAP